MSDRQVNDFKRIAFREMRVVVVPSSGFGNRIRMMASCSILAEMLSTKLEVVWTPTDDCHVMYEDLFSSENQFVKVDLGEVTKQKYYYRGHVHTNEILPVIEQISKEYEVLLLEGGHEFKIPSMSVEEFIAKKQGFYQSLKFTSEINNLVETYTSRLGDQYITVHYRDVIQRYDAQDIANTPPNTVSAVSFNQNSPIISFYPIIEMFDNSVPILVVSNNSLVLDYIKSRLPKKLLFKTDFNVSNRSERLQMVRSVVEFILMSRSRCVIGTYYSSFSDEACFYNQIPKLIPVTDRLDKELSEKMNYHCYGFGVMRGPRNVYGLNLHNLSQIRNLLTP